MTATIQESSTENEHLLSVSTTTNHIAGTATQVRVRARQHGFTIDEPAELGGDDTGANPVEHLLAALGSCQVITYQVWAQKLGLAIDSINIALSGDIDTRGFFGLSEDARPGFTGIKLDVQITGPESDEAYKKLIAAVSRHCPVEDNLANGVPVTGEVTVNEVKLSA